MRPALITTTIALAAVIAAGAFAYWAAIQLTHVGEDATLDEED